MATIQRLLDIMARLRDPDGGCPWDLEQDFASISPFTIEEAYEVDEAIQSGDLESLRDELGDLLFQVVFQARIAEERGAFDFEGVVEAIASKLVRRHPHVFADAETPTTLEHQTATWESIKAQERAAAGSSGGKQGGPADPFSGIPRNLPALARSAKLAGRLAQIERERLASGSDPLGAGDAPESRSWASAREEVARTLEEAAARLRAENSTPGREAALSMVGRGLRSWVVLARSLGVDPEQALRLADDAELAAARRRIAPR